MWIPESTSGWCRGGRFPVGGAGGDAGRALSCSPSKPASLLLPLTAGTSLECCSRLRTQRGRPIPDRTARYTSTRWTGRFPIDALGDTLNMAWVDDGQVMASVVRLRAALWKFRAVGK